VRTLFSVKGHRLSLVSSPEGKALWPLLTRALIPFMRAHSDDLITSQR